MEESDLSSRNPQNAQDEERKILHVNAKKITQKKYGSAAQIFEELREISAQFHEHRKAYKAMGETYRRVLDRFTSYQTINFSGVFAKTDFLLTEGNASAGLRRHVNDLRIRLKRLWANQLQGDEMSAHFEGDFETLCRFVALVYGEACPSDLEKLFPSHHSTPPQQGETQRTLSDKPTAIATAEELRFVVETWDDTYIYGHADSPVAERQTVCYAQGSPSFPYDRTYLHTLLYKDAQLNLVNPRLRDGIIYPDLIIFDPDNLVNISSIAACFETYGCTPLVHLLNKIMPSSDTEATLLGNFASQLLDEDMRGENVPYTKSARKFFAENATKLLSTPVSPQFHEEGRKQREHIHKAFMEMEQAGGVNSFHRDQVILEPSFFCPMLGIQGRMDLLQLDFRLLVEQKSGKSAFPCPTHPDEKPRPQTKHYVQMLLYMLLVRYNFKSQYNANNRNLAAFLLYSKYEESLCGLGFAPELVFQAIKVRNQIASQDLACIRDGYHQLDGLTPEKLNIKHDEGTLWTRWQCPSISRVLAPIHAASELERAYYYRFLTFIGREQMCSKKGNALQPDTGFASIWLSPLEAKRQAGNIYDNLQLCEPKAGHVGEVTQVTLSFTEDDRNDMANFRLGDIVILYPYKKGTIPQAWKTMVVRCAVADLADGQIRLRIRTPQSSDKVFRHFADDLWAIEHDFMESSYNARYKGLHTFLSAPQSRRDLVLMQRQPNEDKTLQLHGDYGAFNELALRVKQARELFLIIGPPGTGKTSFGMLNTLKEQLSEPNTRVMLAAYTNRAVDEMCGKLIAEGIDFLRLGHELSTVPEVAPYLLENKVKSCKKLDEARELLRTTRVWAGTTTAFSNLQALMSQMTFDLAIVDEASQILEPDLIGLLGATCEGKPSVRKFVLIGDHKQLPAVVQQSAEESSVKSTILHSIGLTNCRLSLFERLLSQYRDNPDVTYQLTRQGRMHQEIAQFSNQHFYRGQLKVVPMAHQIENLPLQGMGANGIADLVATRRVAFVCVPSPSAAQASSDKVNPLEAIAIARLAHCVYLQTASFHPTQSLGVIVPYRNQIIAIRHILEKDYPDTSLRDITIDTVERFQGSQRDCIIYGFTVRKPYQLDFLTSNDFEEDGSLIDRKLNVAMTRAREHLILVGNPDLLSKDPVFHDLIKFTKRIGGYFHIPFQKFLNGDFEVFAIQNRPSFAEQRDKLD